MDVGSLSSMMKRINLLIVFCIWRLEKLEETSGNPCLMQYVFYINCFFVCIVELFSTLGMTLWICLQQVQSFVDQLLYFCFLFKKTYMVYVSQNRVLISTWFLWSLYPVSLTCISHHCWKGKSSIWSQGCKKEGRVWKADESLQQKAGGCTYVCLEASLAF